MRLLLLTQSDGPSWRREIGNSISVAGGNRSNHGGGQLDLVLSNPPYIPTAVMDELEPVVKDHEPHLALCGGGDGLDCCRQIIRDACRALAPGGWILLEHHHDQSAMVLELLTHAGLEQARSPL